jgi:1-acyl-sn-glycerol-3-phosphate acyltransferase
VSDDPEPIDDSITPLISTLTFGGRIFGRAMSRITVEGAIDEIPTEGPLILAANHASNLDAVVLGSWLIPRLGRRIHWLGKKELFAWPIVGWAAANGGVHPVDRGGADVEAFRLAQRILDEGNILFVFPEGTRSPTGRSRRRVTDSRCSRCARARRSSRSGSPARTRSGPVVRSCRTRVAA